MTTPAPTLERHREGAKEVVRIVGVNHGLLGDVRKELLKAALLEDIGRVLANNERDAAKRMRERCAALIDRAAGSMSVSDARDLLAEEIRALPLSEGGEK